MPNEKKLDARMKHSDEEIIEAYEKFGSYNRTARHLGVAAPGLMRRIKRIQRRNPDESIITPAPEIEKPETLKGRSLLRDPQTGETRLEWVKTDVKDEHRLEAMQAAVEVMCEKITPMAASPKPERRNDDLLSCYVLSDAHIGMLAFEEETGGENYDTKIAEQILNRWIESAVELSPDSHTGLLLQLGDWLHFDGMVPETPASKHHLDTDTRFQLLVKVAIRVLRGVVDHMLAKHEHVHIIMADANHDPASGAWLREMFSVLYENEPRITVDTSADSYYAYQWGDVSLFAHHGHKAKMQSVSQVFAGKFREIFGSTTYSYAHVGHCHHAALKEDSMMIVEQHTTLAARDAYAAKAGYINQRGASVITYHKKYGEVGRVTIRPEMLL